MCGICGYVNLRGDADFDPALIRGMARTLVHRGPDEEGYHIEAPCALGMRRLRIIDVHTGSQPVYNEDESVWVSPGIPFIVPTFLGLLLALTVGDLLFLAMQVLGLVG